MQSVHLNVSAPASRQPGVNISLTEAAVLQMLPGEYMNPAQLQFFRLRLKQIQAALIVSLTLEGRDSAAELTADPMDRASAEESQSQALRAHAREGMRLKDVTSALARIDSGEYGWCDETGDEIGLRRLIAQPTATLTYEAQQRRESLAKFRN